MQKIRVGILTSSFPIHKDSVSGIFILRLIQHYSGNIQTIVFTPATNTPTTNRTHQENFEIVSFRYAPMRWQVLAHQPGGIPAALSENKWLYLLLPFLFLSMIVTCFRYSGKIDLFHANWSVNGIIAGLVGAATGIPVVTTLRGSDFNRAKSSRLYRHALNLCIRLSRYIITVSNSINSNVMTLFPDLANDKVITIPNGVADSLLEKPIKIASDESQNIRLIIVGSLTKNKGVDQVVDAMVQFDSRHLILKIIGDGPEKLSLERLVASHGLNSQILFIGTVPANELHHHLASSDILVLSSWSEGRPNVVLEAMAAGLPVVATNIEGVSEIVKDAVTGLLYDPGNIKQLANHLARLGSDQQLRIKLGKAGRDFIKDNALLWSNTAKQYESIYRSAVSPSFGNKEELE